MSDEKDKSVARESASARLPRKGKVCAGLLSAPDSAVEHGVQYPSLLENDRERVGIRLVEVTRDDGRRCRC